MLAVLQAKSLPTTQRVERLRDRKREIAIINVLAKSGAKGGASTNHVAKLLILA
jgi:hypothetical protein